MKINAKAGFNDYIEKNLGSYEKRYKMIKKFMAQEDVMEILGETFVSSFLAREPTTWLQQKPIALDFANSG